MDKIRGAFNHEGVILRINKRMIETWYAGRSIRMDELWEQLGPAQQGANPFMLQKTRTSWRPSKIDLDNVRRPDRGQMLEPGHQVLLADEHTGGRIPISTMIRARWRTILRACARCEGTRKQWENE